MGGFLLISSFRSKQNFNLSYLLGKTWKIDQLYIDSVRSYEPFKDSLRYTFQSNSQLQISNLVSTGTATWQSNTEQNKLIITYPSENNQTSQDTFNIVHLSPNIFVFTTKTINLDSSSQSLVMEYRMKPQ
jgi:hypothetical protein